MSFPCHKLLLYELVVVKTAIHVRNLQSHREIASGIYARHEGKEMEPKVLVRRYLVKTEGFDRPISHPDLQTKRVSFVPAVIN